MEFTLDIAKAVIDTAIPLGAFEWDPGASQTDESYLKEAARLMTAVQELSKKGNVNEGVLDLLHAAGVEPLSDQTREAYLQRFGADSLSDGASPAPAPVDSSAFAGGNSREESSPAGSASASAFSPAPQTIAEAAALTPQETAAADALAAAAGVQRQPEQLAAGEFDINSVYPGYDDQKVADIKKAVLHFASTGELTPQEWEQIKAYEAANEERKTILSLQPEFPAPEPPRQAEIQVTHEATGPFPVHAETPEPTNAFGGTPQPSVAGRSDVVTDHQQSATDFFAGGAREEGGDSVQAFYNGETISRAAQEGLPIPASPQADPAALVMPIDITNTSSEELSRLATAYYSYFSRTEWLISQESGRERAAEQLEHDAHRDAYTQALANHKSAIPEGKSGPTAIDAARKLAEKDADGAHAVHNWRTKKIRHGIDLNELKALARIYDKGMWRINEELERRARLATTAGGAQR